MVKDKENRCVVCVCVGVGVCMCVCMCVGVWVCVCVCVKNKTWKVLYNYIWSLKVIITKTLRKEENKRNIRPRKRG